MDLLKHFEESLAKANNFESKLEGEVLNIQGWSSPKQKHLLNNLCSSPDARYLEIGVWKGATHVAALYQNDIYSMAIDDFSQHWNETGYPVDTITSSEEMEMFQSNCMSFLGKQVPLLNGDYLSVCNQLKKNDFNIYFYDGGHEELQQEEALTKFYPYLRKDFIYIVDDWNVEEVRTGTENALNKLNVDVLGRWELEANKVGDLEEWWNGLLVVVCRKKTVTRKKKD